MSEEMSEYTRRYVKETAEGQKDWYRCKGHLKCKKYAYIHLHSNSFECSIYQSTEDHLHQTHPSKIPQQIQDLVQQCIKDNIISNKTVKRAIDQQLNRIKDKQARKWIENDIINFQHFVTAESFIQVARLMITTWKNKFPSLETDEFIKYFNKQWLSPKRNGWYDHYCDHSPCQNNSLESTNRYVKEEGTLRQRIGVMQFLNILETGFVKRWSTDTTVTVLVEGQLVNEPNKNLKKFNNEPVFDLKDYTCAYQWGKLDKVITRIKQNNEKFYCAPSSDKIKQVSEQQCKNPRRRRGRRIQAF